MRAPNARCWKHHWSLGDWNSFLKASPSLSLFYLHIIFISVTLYLFEKQYSPTLLSILSLLYLNIFSLFFFYSFIPFKYYIFYSFFIIFFILSFSIFKNPNGHIFQRSYFSNGHIFQRSYFFNSHIFQRSYFFSINRTISYL